MAREWPDYESEMKKKAKAKKNGDDFIVSDDEDEDMKNSHYRAKKRKQTGTGGCDYLIFRFLVCLFVFFSWFIVPG